VQKSYTYDVYGKPTATGSLANEFDFAGQQTDPTGLQYLRARYMDPATGRFISRDSLASHPAWTGESYAYGSANPVRVTDPAGLCGYYGDPADPWCKEQKNPKENVNDDYKQPKGHSSAAVGEVVSAVITATHDAIVWWGNNVEKPKLQAALASGQLIGACLSDLVCSSSVSAALHSLGKAAYIGPAFETLAQTWDDLSAALSDLPGLYPTPNDGRTVPAFPGLIGESSCP
jgi:RHS repeat-associated protein